MTSERLDGAAAAVAALARAARAPVSARLLLALAFVVKNRLAPEASALPPLPVLAQGRGGRSLRAAAEAALERAYEGRMRDPTRGAIALHRHDEAPRWARRLRATALIGPYLFLAPPAPVNP